MVKTVTIAQLIFIVFVFGLSFISGILPHKIPWCKNSVNILGIANAFSGGVFLAIAFMHILPEVTKDYEEYLHPDEESQIYAFCSSHFSWLFENTATEVAYSVLKGGLTHGDGDNDFPLPFALTFAGYAFILLIDKIVFDTHQLVDSDHHSHKHEAGHKSKKVKESPPDYKKMLSGEFGIKNDDHKMGDNHDMVLKNQSFTRNEKFSVRMSAALHKRDDRRIVSRSQITKVEGLDDSQNDLFVDAGKVMLKDDTSDNDKVNTSK